MTYSFVSTEQLLPSTAFEKSQVQHTYTEDFSIIFWYSQTPKLKVVVYKNPAAKTGTVLFKTPLNATT
jgi:hypothetical protein